MEQESIIYGLFDKVEEEKTNSKEFSKLLSKYIKQKSEFDKTITDEQREELNNAIDTLHDMTAQENKEFFKIGFLMSAKLLAEAYCSKDN